MPVLSLVLLAAPAGIAFASIATVTQTISFSSLANKLTTDADFTLSAVASSGLNVTFAASGNCTVTGALVHITGAGSCTITASQAGGPVDLGSDAGGILNYSAATDVPQSFTITTPAPIVPACDPSNTFDTFTLGSVNGQGGWGGQTPPGIAINPSLDQAIVSNTYGYPTFGCQSLRVSDSVTSGSFGDQIFSPSITNEAGETTANNNGMSGGTRQNHFEAQFDLASAMATLQPGMHMSVSPDRGDGARMSYLRFEDQEDGIHVHFVDTPNPSHIVNSSGFFPDTDIATLDRTVPHTIKFSMDFVDGPDNDVVKIFIDGALVHTGTSWEDYYRFATESQGSPHDPSLENMSRTVDSLLFRESGTADIGNAGKGFLVDNFSLSSSSFVPAHLTIIKHAFGGNDTFNFTVASSSMGISEPVSVTTTNGVGTSDSISLAPGTYNVNELFDSEIWRLSNNNCIYDNESVGTSLSTGGEQITVDAGDSVTCTFTNSKLSPAMGTLVIKKVVSGSTATPNMFSWVVNAPGEPTHFSVSGENDLSMPIDTFSVSEIPASGYTTTYSNDANENTNCNNLVVSSGATTTCTVTNTFQAPAPSGDGGGSTLLLHHHRVVVMGLL